jgi:tRNA A37 threonylcarbamoyladenosine modification protein TsaB
MVDARKQQVYAALYRVHGGMLTQAQPPAVVDPVAWVESLPGPAVLIGTGAAEYHGSIAAAAADKGCVIVSQHLGIPRASTVAELAQTRYDGCAGRPELVRALYVRPPDIFVDDARK